MKKEPERGKKGMRERITEVLIESLEGIHLVNTCYSLLGIWSLLSWE